MNAEIVVFVPNGDRIVCIPLDLPDDTLLEGEESFPLEIDSVSPVPGVEIGDQSTTTVFIVDNDSTFNTTTCIHNTLPRGYVYTPT